MKKLTVVLVALCFALVIMLPLAALAAEVININGVSYAPIGGEKTEEPKGTPGHEGVFKMEYMEPVGSGAEKSDFWAWKASLNGSSALLTEGLGLPRCVNVVYRIDGSRSDDANGHTRDTLAGAVGVGKECLPTAKHKRDYTSLGARFLFRAEQVQMSYKDQRTGREEGETNTYASLLVAANWTYWDVDGKTVKIGGKDIDLYQVRRLGEVKAEVAAPLGQQGADYALEAKFYLAPQSIIGLGVFAFVEGRGWDRSMFTGGGLCLPFRQRSEFCLKAGNRSGSEFELENGNEAGFTFSTRI